MANEEEKSKIPRRAALTAHDQAIKYLSMRSHTEFELRRKLSGKKFPRQDIDDAIRRLREYKYLDDREFAVQFAQNLIRYKTFGYFGIKYKLKARGIEDELAEEVLGQELDLEAEKKIAQRAVDKAKGKVKIKLMQMLQRKGFRGQVIAETMSSWS
jgi:regulatory protein